MSSSKDSGSGGITKNILILKGTSNYHAWLDVIQSFLMTLKVWRIASKASTFPALALPTITMEHQNAWLDSDYQAVGVISLYIKEDLQTSVTRMYDVNHTFLSFTTLVDLTTLYTTTSPISQFYLLGKLLTGTLETEIHLLR